VQLRLLCLEKEKVKKGAASKDAIAMLTILHAQK
jgi:hypothetical protein